MAQAIKTKLGNIFLLLAPNLHVGDFLDIQNYQGSIINGL